MTDRPAPPPRKNSRLPRAEAEQGLRALGFTRQEAADLVEALQEVEPPTTGGSQTFGLRSGGKR